MVGAQSQALWVKPVLSSCSQLTTSPAAAVAMRSSVLNATEGDYWKGTYGKAHDELLNWDDQLPLFPSPISSEAML